MCLTLLNSFNHMKSFAMFIFSWLKFVKKRGTSIYLWGYMSCLLFCVFIAPSRFGTIWNYLFSTRIAELSEIDNISKPWWFGNSRRGMTLLRRETPAFAQQKWPGSTLYHYGLRELAQRQAVFVRQDKSPVRAIKPDRAKDVMTAGCISRTGQR